MKTLGYFYEITFIKNGEVKEMVPCLKKKDAVETVNRLQAQGLNAWYTNRSIWK